MAQGKSKKVYGKKGQKKKVVDSLSRKEWFELKAPAPFQSESFGFTCANRTQGLSIISIYLRKSRRQHQRQSRLTNASRSRSQPRHLPLEENQTYRRSDWGQTSHHQLLRCWYHQRWAVLTHQEEKDSYWSHYWCQIAGWVCFESVRYCLHQRIIQPKEKDQLRPQFSTEDHPQENQRDHCQGSLQSQRHSSA